MKRRRVNRFLSRLAGTVASSCADVVPMEVDQITEGKGNKVKLSKGVKSGSSFSLGDSSHRACHPCTGARQLKSDTPPRCLYFIQASSDTSDFVYRRLHIQPSYLFLGTLLNLASCSFKRRALNSTSNSNV